MPIKYVDQISESKRINEIRKIKIGEKQDKKMLRYDSPVVSFPVKRKAGAAFDVDENLMDKIRDRYGLQKKDVARGLAAAPVPAIPIRFMSDDLFENFHMYRAIYNASQESMCFSSAGSPKASRWFDEKSKGEDGKLKILDEPLQVDCDESCRFWTEPGDEKGKCGWKFMLAAHCEDLGVVPDVTIFRSSGFTLASHLAGSINHIKSITGGVLANIPLVLALDHRETRTGRGEKRRHQVMLVRFNGTVDELREAAINEIKSRRALFKAVKPNEGDYDPRIDVGFGLTAPFARFEDDEDEADATKPEDGAIAEAEEFIDTSADGAVDVPSPTAAPDAPIEADATEDLLRLKNTHGLSDRELDELLDQNFGDVMMTIAEIKRRFVPLPAAKPVQPVSPPPTNVSSPPPPPPPAPVSDPVPAMPDRDAFGAGDWSNGEASNEPSDHVVDEDGMVVAPPDPPPPWHPREPESKPAPQPEPETKKSEVDDLMDESFFDDLL